ncbi:DNA alkylation repair protein [Bacillus pumilus]|uniref:DNA alkylation repair protein n=1 Tax=Bacillus pumilus TaxID=1408 RepID=UPI0015D5464B|nr:DNA alkylation repair protein [Bacillus pumilus]QLI76335.1 DNA alkylation repair protein [Bacillus pumilus]
MWEADTIEPLKHVYNELFIQELAEKLAQASSGFDAERFKRLVFQEDWQQLELKGRMRRVTESMHACLPQNYEKTIEVLRQAAPHFSGLSALVFPDYVETYGLANWDISIKALEFFTPFSTSEFAVRPFLIQDQDKMLAQMLVWSQDQDEHLRRLASEGCRPRLPWGLSVPSLKKNPSVTLPILENLKADPSRYVQKSVANHLNDISAIQPDLMKQTVQSWYGTNKHTNWIVKHASRTLLKKGDPAIMALFGYGDDPSVQVTDLKIVQDPIRIAEKMTFHFTLQADKPLKLRVEYAIDYVKARGTRNQKVFKITEFETDATLHREFVRSQSFQNMTTRKHYEGTHTLTIIINGIPKASVDFEVTEDSSL